MRFVLLVPARIPSCLLILLASLPVTALARQAQTSPGGPGTVTPDLEPGTQRTPPAAPMRERTQTIQESAERANTFGVYPALGEFHLEVEDLRIPGRGLDLVLSRSYRSGFPNESALGHGWDFSYNVYLEAAGPDLLVHDGNARVDLYSLQQNGTFTHPEFFRELIANGDGSFTLKFAETGRWVFSALGPSPAAGRLSQIIDRNGNSQTLTYDGSGRLVRVADAVGHSLDFTYDASSRLIRATDHAARSWTYTHYQSGDADGSDGDLKSATSPAVTGTPNGNDFPAGKTTTYCYSTGFADERLNHNLLRIISARGNVVLINRYSPTTRRTDLYFDRVVRQVIDGQKIHYSYQRLAAPGAVHATIKDRAGNVEEHSYDAPGRLIRRREHTRGLRPTDPSYYDTFYQWNPNALLTRILHPNGNVTRFTYDSMNPDPRSRGDLLEHRRIAGPPGGDQARIIETLTYDPTFHRMTSRVDGRGQVWTYTYDPANGNLLAIDYPLVTTGVDGGGTQMIREEFQYNGSGQVTLHTNAGCCDGSSISYSYFGTDTQKGFLKSKTVDQGGLNLMTSYTYDAVGNLVTVTDPNGNVVQSVRNALNQVVRKIDPAPFLYETDYFHDLDDNVVRVDVQNVDDLGQVQSNTHFTTTYAYDSLDRRIREEREVDSVGSVAKEFEYDLSGNVTLIRFGEAVNGTQPANVLRTFYDERDLVWLEIRGEGDPAASTTQYDYDGNRNLVAQREGLESNPRVHQYLYDGFDRRIQHVDPMGNVRTWHYDAGGNTTSSRQEGEQNDLDGGAANVLLAETMFGYDEINRRILQSDLHFDPATQAPFGDGFSTRRSYFDSQSRMTRSEDDNAFSTTYQYDSAGRVSIVTDPEGNTASFDYDLNGNVLQETRTWISDLTGLPAYTVTTQYQYDTLDRLVWKSDNLANTTQYFYDSRSNRTRTIDPRGNTTALSYDGLNRLIATVRTLTDTGDGSGTMIGEINTIQTFDDSSRLTSQTDDNGNTTAYSYDALDRRIVVDHPDCTSRQFFHDVHDNVVQQVDANGTVVDDAFDRGDRLKTRTVTPGPGVLGTTFETYQYDGLSRVVRANDDDSRITFSFDSLANIIAETQRLYPAGTRQTITYSYDGVGNRIRVVYPSGRTIDAGYDGLRRPLFIQDATSGALLAAYSYVGRKPELRDLWNGTRAEYTYDAIMRMITTRHTTLIQGYPFDERSYQWDSGSNKTQMDRVIGYPYESKTYAYDSIDRLIRSYANPYGPFVDYNLDDAGNRTYVSPYGSYFMDPTLCEPGDFQMNQYTTTPFDTRTYDQNGSLATSFYGYVQYGYDYRNQLVQRSDGYQGTTAIYAYDCLGRRIEQNVNGGATRYYYSGMQLVEEQDAFENVIATHVWGQGRTELVHSQRWGIDHYFHQDDRSNVVAATDAFGNVVEQYQYEDFGRPQFFDAFGGFLHSSQIDNSILWGGHWRDAASGLYSIDDRWMEPDTGRFTTRDDTVTMNISRYGNSYTCSLDSPTTEDCCLWCCVEDLELVTSGKLQGGKKFGDYYPGLEGKGYWGDDGSTAGGWGPKPGKHGGQEGSRVGYKVQFVGTANGLISLCYFTQWVTPAKGASPFNDFAQSGEKAHNSEPLRQDISESEATFADPTSSFVGKDQDPSKFKDDREFTTCWHSFQGGCVECAIDKICIKWSYNYVYDADKKEGKIEVRKISKSYGTL